MLLVLTLKIKLPFILPAKMGVFGVAENCDLRQASYSKTIGKSEKREWKGFLWRIVGELGRFNQKAH